MDTQKHINEQHLLDYFSGTLAPAQKQEVESWIQESEENKKMARDIEYIYFATDTLNTIKSVDSTLALGEVKEKINRKGDNKHSFIFWLQRIAAILVIPLLISTLYFATKQDPVEFIEIRTNPGMVAVVNLPDGSIRKSSQEIHGALNWREKLISPYKKISRSDSSSTHHLT